MSGYTPQLRDGCSVEHAAARLHFLLLHSGAFPTWPKGSYYDLPKAQREALVLAADSIVDFVTSVYIQQGSRRDMTVARLYAAEPPADGDGKGGVDGA